MYELKVSIKKTVFFSSGDEAWLFNWLSKIKSIVKVKGVGRDLVLMFSSLEISDESLKECIALFSRYNLDMTKLSVFLNKQNEIWFCKPRTYWYKKVFKNL